MEAIEIQKQMSLFQKLSNKRKKDADVLLDFEYRGIWETAIKKYSATAHFVYELLQNADDAKATWVEFKLESNGFWFKHNGKHFSISDTDTTEIDTKSGKLGDLNSITSIGNSSKIEEQKIGKFGIGFKSVFAYTKSPKVYDDTFNFELENYIIPVEITPIINKRINGETLFYFPFNLDSKPKKDAYNEIEEKLESLFQPILFLTYLQKIKWVSTKKDGNYSKQIIKSDEFQNIRTDLVEVVSIDNGDIKKEYIWLFSNAVIHTTLKSNHRIEVGFFVLEQKELEIGFQYEAFCFFPTKEETKLGFIIQAPFLLTDNREGIKANETWNNEIMQLVAELAADSISILKEIGIREKSYLLNDNILELIPYKESDFSDIKDKTKISFKPFYNTILQKFKTEQILPGRNRKYYTTSKAYWASDPYLAKLFSDKQISHLLDNPDSGFVFISKGQKQLNQANKPLETYISSIVTDILDPKKLLRRVTANFIEAQTDEWLIKFYSYLFGHESLWDDKEKLALKKPILLNQERKAVIPFTENLTTANIFIPTENHTSFDTIYKPFIENEKALKFFISLGLGKPDLRAEIFLNIVPLYNENFDYNDRTTILSHLNLFLDYFTNCYEDAKIEFLSCLRKIEFIAAKKKSDDDTWFCSPNEVYFNSENLNLYFGNNPDVYFLYESYYENYIASSKKSLFFKFLSELGVSYIPRILEISESVTTGTKKGFGIDKYEISRRYSSDQTIINKKLDGLTEAIKSISNNQNVIINIENNVVKLDEKIRIETIDAIKKIDIGLSVIIWDYLLKIAEGNSISTFIKYLQGDFIYIPKNYNNYRYEKFDSTLIKMLRRTYLWVFDKNGNLVKDPLIFQIQSLSTIADAEIFWEEHRNEIEDTKYEDILLNKHAELLQNQKINTETKSQSTNQIYSAIITKKELNQAYDLQHPFVSVILEFIEIKDLDENLNLNDQQKQDLEIGRRIREEGITQDEIANIIAARKIAPSQPKTTVNALNFPNDNEQSNKGSEEKPNGDENPKQSKKNDTEGIPKPFIHNRPIEEPEAEEDELVPIMVDPKDTTKNFEEIDKKKEQEYLDEKELRKRRAEYQEIVQNSEMYSFGWFKALLELEDSFTAEDRVKRNPIRVVFNKAKLEEDGTIQLYDTPYIPPTIDDVGDLQIIFYYGPDSEEKKTVYAEVISPQKDKIITKLEKPEALIGFDLSTITKAVVEVSNADFILEKLKNAFKRLQYADADNLCNFLPNSLNFVFGPPGTGKTTYLSWLIGGLNRDPLTLASEPISPLMDKENKVLVLTPTNKAADVLVEKIIENYAEAERCDYQNWLIRFGETKSDALMNSGLFIKDRKVQSFIYSRCTFVTTIARFPYDNFKVQRKNKEDDKWDIKYFNWDYIIFDEASMISLAGIVYVIYQASKVNPNVKFIIGGDPFQIHPIIQFRWEGWSFIKETAINKEGKQVEYEQDAGNIYSMVGLINDKSFVTPQTIPHPFPVHNLTMQFRSIEPIGALFSNYRYNDKLQHDRIPERIALHPKKDIKKIAVHNLPLKPITLIHFPIKKYEKLYRAHSIKGSPYHLYAAIFIVEMLKYIQKNGTINPDSNYKIGVICPFKIQESIINNLVGKTCKGKIEIVTGTVHGFQGDQCDMIITVFNPPSKITISTRSFLNKKNILNVAISRARDCLIILVPENQEGDIKVDDLHQIERIKKLIRRLPETKEHYIEYRAEDLEQTLFKNGERIKNFAIPFTHQNINVYEPSKIKYEIRIDENAIDINLE